MRTESSRLPYSSDLAALARSARFPHPLAGSRPAQRIATESQPPPADSARTARIKSEFEKRFGALANDPAKFHEMLRTIYGENYDFAKAEALRERALAGDFSWLPPIEFASAVELHGANGAYDAKDGVVYLNEDLMGDPKLLAATYLEEAGHHLDTLLGAGDAAGDEGELFRRLLSGEDLSAAQIAAIKSENDHGVITVDGKQIEVEFWFEDVGQSISDGFKAAGDFVSDATKPVRDTAKAVGDAVGAAGSSVMGAVRNAVESADSWLGATFGPFGDAFGDVLRGAAGGLVTFGQGVADIFVWPLIDVFEGRFADALESPVRGLSRIFIQSPERFLNGFLDGAETLTRAIPIPIVSDVLTRGVDIVRTLSSMFFGLADDTLRFCGSMITDPARHLETAIHRLFRGDFGGFALSLLWAAISPITNLVGFVTDGAFRVLSAIGAIVGDLGASPPSRGLSASEKDDLRAVYGDSVDLDQIRIRRNDVSNQAGMNPHTVGNTIYMPESMTAPDGTVIPLFNADGSLTDAGKIVLAHEVGHVWQNQNGGGDYMHTAVCAQCEALAASLASGSNANVGAAYDWRAQADQGVPFDELTPEQQASLMEDAAAAQLLGDGDGKLETSDFAFNSDYTEDPMTDEQLAYLNAALELVRRGDGASIHGGLG